jgi:protoheme ferro-lyase
MLKLTKCLKRNQKLAVVTPAFVSDCLETLEEIAMEPITSSKSMVVKNLERFAEVA